MAVSEVRDVRIVEEQRPEAAAHRVRPRRLRGLRVWVLPHSGQRYVVNPTWGDPALWGVLLAAVAGHAAKACAAEGRDEAEAFRRICESLEAELNDPTDAAVQIAP